MNNKKGKEMSVHKSRLEKNNKVKVPKVSNTNKSVDNRKSNSKEKIQYWIDFSTNPQKPEVVREYLLNKELRDNVSITYICQYHPMSCEFIEELIALSTNMFTNETYTKENVEFVLEVIRCNNTREAQKVVDRYQKENPDNRFMWFVKTKANGDEVILKAKHISTRVDWFNIVKYQNIEPWFKEKYGHLFMDKVSVSSKAEMETWENF